MSGWEGLLGRREFIALIAGVAMGLPVAARAQEQGKLPVIGFLGADKVVTAPWTAAFTQRLSELGWVDGRNIRILYRWAEGRADSVAAFTAEFVGTKVDIIVASGIAVATVKRATSEIPIVFPMSNDPVGAGLVENLARPGGNTTGLSNQATDLAGKRLEILRDVVPGLRRLAIMANADFPQAVLERDAVQTHAKALNLDVIRMDVRRVENIAPAFAANGVKPDALYVVGDAFLNSNRSEIATLALRARLPAIFSNRTFVATGGLISYGPDFTDQWRRSAELVDKILRGTKPADIPVEQPRKFELILNLKTAKAIGLAIPPTLLARVDGVIE